jgi:glucose dehydrogenase
MIPQPGKVVRGVCPNAPGAKDWSPSAFSKVTGLLYVPHNNLCMDWLLTKPNYIAGTPYIGVTPLLIRARRQCRRVHGLGPGQPAQGLDDQGALAGLERRGGHRVGDRFLRNLEGWFKAVDADTGKLLWQFQTGSGIIGQPTIFAGPTAANMSRSSPASAAGSDR